jgi:hypothetical protein
VVKEEANEALEDTAPPGAGNLPPEYHAILAVGYDEDTLLQQVLEAYKANEDARFPNLQEALTLTGMVAEHLASMPPPHPLSAHTSPQTAYLRQEVPPPPVLHPSGIVRTTRTDCSSTLHSPSQRLSSTSSPTTRSSWRRHDRWPKGTAS